MEMARERICRVWYGKRWGIQQSFKDIDDFFDAADFAALIFADGIEVIREPLRPAVAMDGRTITTAQQTASP